jgi:hypothetical protein
MMGVTSLPSSSQQNKWAQAWMGILLSFMFIAATAKAHDEVATVIIAASGTLETLPGQAGRAVLRKSPLHAGAILTTPANGGAQIRFLDGTVFSLSPASKLAISSNTHFPTNAPMQLGAELVKGGLRAISGYISKSNPDGFELRARDVSIGIRGTHFDVVLRDDTQAFGIYAGRITLQLQQQRFDLARADAPQFGQFLGQQWTTSNMSTVALTEESAQRQKFLTAWRRSNKVLPIGEDSDLLNLIDESDATVSPSATKTEH